MLLAHPDIAKPKLFITVGKFVEFDDTIHRIISGHGDMRHKQILVVVGNFNKTGTLPRIGVVQDFRNALQEFTQVEKLS